MRGVGLSKDKDVAKHKGVKEHGWCLKCKLVCSQDKSRCEQ
jgi:hypothetical protein